MGLNLSQGRKAALSVILSADENCVSVLIGTDRWQQMECRTGARRYSGQGIWVELAVNELRQTAATQCFGALRLEDGQKRRAQIVPRRNLVSRVPPLLRDP